MFRHCLAFAAAISMMGACVAIRAANEIVLKDEFDDKKVVSDAREYSEVKKLAEELDEFLEYVSRYKEADLLALFGKPAARPEKMYALPCCERRALTLPVERHSDRDKDHMDFYRIEELAAFEIVYQVDGVSPALVIVYLKVDDKFTPLTKPKDLPERLAWDQERLKQLKKWFRAKRREVFQWEVDEEALQKQLEGDESPDFEVKLKAWLDTGTKLGHVLQTNVGKPGERPYWGWLSEDRSFVRLAQVDDKWKPGDKPIPHSFRWLDARGRTIREQTGRDYLNDFRWKNDDLADIRVEQGEMVRGAWRPVRWMWLSAKTARVLRLEWSDNAEVIPNHVRIWEDEEYKEKPLAIKDSWAVHPELIPEKFRISDEGRKLPIRKIPED
jgi:hypothetical protein